MNIEQIIFKLFSAHRWVRYWKQKEIIGLTMPGEYVEIRSVFLSDTDLADILEAGFKIKRICSKKIDADAYDDILLMREVK